MSSVNRDNFASSFLIYIPFVSFSWLIVLARTSNTAGTWITPFPYNVEKPQELNSFISISLWYNQFCYTRVHHSSKNLLLYSKDLLYYGINAVKSECACLVPDFLGKAFSFIMLAVGLSYMDFIILRYVLSIPSLLRFFIIHMLFCIYYGCWTILESLE